MERHFLVSVSEKSSAIYGIKFLCNLLSDREKTKIILFHTLPKPPSSWERDHTDIKTEIDKQMRRYEAIGREALEKAKKELLKLGFPDSHIQTRLNTRPVSKISGIIQEGEKGQYNTVVLGRRGLSWLEEAFEDSISKGVFKEKFNIPLWLCRKPDMDRRNVLVCVDGSDAAYRITDHVGFVLDDEYKHKVTLLMVTKENGSDEDKVKSILTKSKHHLHRNGVPMKLIKTRVEVSDKPADTILKIAEKDRFAAVALGHREMEYGFLKKIFTDSVSHKLFRELENSALLLSH
ncbi:universal stress protein [Thermodesulfobacteriota bacterium]